MSGGSFNYVCFSSEDATEIFGKMDDVRGIEEWLRANERHDAADEILLYIKEMETHRRRIEAIGKRLSGLMQSVEWTASSDTGIESVDLEWSKLSGLTE